MAEREHIWKLLREQLVYISQDEMHHLVSLTGPQSNAKCVLPSPSNSTCLFTESTMILKLVFA